MLRRAALCSLLTVGASLLAAPHSAIAAPKITSKLISKSGAKLSKCPAFIGVLKSGLYSNLSPNIFCGSGFNKIKKLNSRKVGLPLINAAVRGSTFESLDNQQGETKTELFEIKNYPAIISYQVTGAGAKFKIELLDSTEKRVDTLVDRRGEGSNTIALNTSGQFSLHITASASGRDAEQPTYSVSMTFMDPYEGAPVSVRDLIEAGIKTLPCPKSILDASATMTDIPSTTICTKKNPEDAGMTPAPFNAATGLFITSSLQFEGSGDSTSLPFRALAGTRVSYSVTDPSPNGTGSLRATLVEMGSGKSIPLVSTKGSITGGSTVINKAGDYSVVVETKSTKPEENGELSYSISTQ